jgi:hypothetical protein
VRNCRETHGYRIDIARVCLIGKCLSQFETASAVRLSKFARFCFLKIWSHAILFVRSPMKRTRCGHALPETLLPHVGPAAVEPSVHRPRAFVADRRGRTTDHPLRGPPSHRRARSPECPPSRARRSGPSVGIAAPAGKGRKFPPRKPLKTNETELEYRQILPVRRTPVQRPSRRSESSWDTASVLGAVRGKSAGWRMRGGEIFLSATA